MKTLSLIFGILATILTIYWSVWIYKSIVEKETLPLILGVIMLLISSYGMVRNLINYKRL